MTYNAVREIHFNRLGSYRQSAEYAEYAKLIGAEVPQGELPSLLETRWEIDEEIYNEFLDMLPPLGWRGGSFYMREFSFGDITTNYSREGDKYYCEFARFPERNEATDAVNGCGSSLAVRSESGTAHPTRTRQHIVVADRETRTLPPDPEGMNDKRADWAAAAITAFQDATGTEVEDALSDLIADLMHWADRENFDFEAALSRARDHYEAETIGEDSGDSRKPIVIEVLGGVVQAVHNVPPGFEYEIIDHDDREEADTDEGRAA